MSRAYTRPCFCDRYRAGEPFQRGRDCVLCWQYHNNPKYRALWSQQTARTGQHLRRILSWFHAAEIEACRCAERANQMDLLGVDWCEQNQALIVSWLMESWDKQKLSLSDFLPAEYRRWTPRLLSGYSERKIAERGARWAVKLALRRARADERNYAKASSDSGAQMGAGGYDPPLGARSGHSSGVS